MKITQLILLLLFHFSVVAQNGLRGGEVVNTSQQKIGVTHAILIGVSEYKNLPQSHQLNFADDDALLFQEYLKSQGNVLLKTFLNSKASGKDFIGREIQNTLINEAKPGDHVLIYFAGHGDIDTLLAPQEGFLLLNNVDPPIISSYEFSDAISLNSLRKFINLAAEKKQIEVTLIADACHSGAVKNGAANNAFLNINSKVTTITSCKASEVSEESINWGGGHGVFTYYLVQGLTGMADIEGDNANNDGIVTLDELEGYVKSRVSKDRLKMQSPIFESNNNLSFSINHKLLEIIKKNKGVNFNSFKTLNSTKAVSSKIDNVKEPCKTNLRLFYQQVVNGKFFLEDLDSIDRLPFSFELAQTNRLHNKKINAISTSFDGFLTATSSEQGLAITTGMDMERVKWLKDINSEVKALDFSPSKYYLAIITAENKVVVWDVAKGVQLMELSKFSSSLNAIKFVSQNQVAITTEKGNLLLWDLISNTTKEYKLHKGSISSISTNGNFIYTSGIDNSIVCFDLSTLKKSNVFFQNTSSTVVKLTYNLAKNQLFGGTIDGKILIWDISSNKLLKQIVTDVGQITGLDTDPSSQYCFFSGIKQKKTGYINLNTSILEKSKLYTTGSATGVSFDSNYGVIKTIEYDGSYTIQKVKILPQDASATSLYDKVLLCDELQSLKYKIDGTLIVGLNQKVNQVLDQLVNGKELPSYEDLKQAIRNAKKAYEIGKEDELSAEELKINLSLLQVYETVLYKKTQNYSEAKILLKEIEKIDPNGAYVYNVSANLYLLLNDVEEAKKMALKAEKLAPNWTETMVNTGKVFQQIGDLKSAEIRFKSAINNAPDQTKGYLALGSIYSQQGKYKEALVQFEKAFEKNPNSEEVRLRYKECYEKLPNLSKPANIFETFLNQGQNLITNQTVFKNFNNEIKFIDAKIPIKCRFVCENATLKLYNNKWYLIPLPNVKTVTIKILDLLTDESIAIQDFEVRNIPKLEFLWGKSKDGGFVSLNSTTFYLGYLNEPELENCGINLKGYEAVFIDENTSVLNDFNPSKEGGVVAFQGEGKAIHPGIFAEIKKRQSNEIVGKVCVQYLIEYPSGVTEVKSACFSY